MIGGFFAVIITMGLIGLTVAKAVQLFWPWMIVVAIASALLAIIVKLIRNATVQHIVIALAIALSGVIVFTQLPFHVATVFCFLLIGAVLYTSAAIAAEGKEAIHGTARAVGVQILWLAPLTMTFYSYSFISPSDAVAPGATTLVGLIAAIWIGGDV
jgi:hypothetical protein